MATDYIFLVSNQIKSEEFKTLDAAIDYVENETGNQFYNVNTSNAMNNIGCFSNGGYYKLADKNSNYIIRRLPVIEEDDSLKLYYSDASWAGISVVIAKNRKEAVDLIMNNGNSYGMTSDFWENYYSIECKTIVNGLLITNYGDQ